MDKPAMQVVLEADDAICVIDQKGNKLLETRFRVEEVLNLKPGEKLEVQNQYKIYKPFNSDGIQVIFPFHGDWIVVEATVQQLTNAMFATGC